MQVPTPQRWVDVGLVYGNNEITRGTNLHSGADVERHVVDLAQPGLYRIEVSCESCVVVREDADVDSARPSLAAQRQLVRARTAVDLECLYDNGLRAYDRAIHAIDCDVSARVRAQARRAQRHLTSSPDARSADVQDCTAGDADPATVQLRCKPALGTSPYKDRSAIPDRTCGAGSGISSAGQKAAGYIDHHVAGPSGAHASGEADRSAFRARCVNGALDTDLSVVGTQLDPCRAQRIRCSEIEIAAL